MHASIFSFILFKSFHTSGDGKKSNQPTKTTNNILFIADFFLLHYIVTRIYKQREIILHEDFLNSSTKLYFINIIQNLRIYTTFIQK